MLYAATCALRHGVEIAEFDLVAARRVRGVVDVIAYDASTCSGTKTAPGVAVIARGYWLARKVLANLMVQWCGDSSEREIPSGAALLGEHAVGHCTAQLVDGRLRLWVATRNAARLRATVVQVADIAQDLVDLNPVRVDSIEPGPGLLAPAIAIARLVQPLPVQVIGQHDLACRAETLVLAAAPSPQA